MAEGAYPGTGYAPPPVDESVFARYDGINEGIVILGVGHGNEWQT